jgi:hypothetical protein
MCFESHLVSKRVHDAFDLKLMPVVYKNCLAHRYSSRIAFSQATFVSANSIGLFNCRRPTDLRSASLLLHAGFGIGTCTGGRYCGSIIRVRVCSRTTRKQCKRNDEHQSKKSKQRFLQHIIYSKIETDLTVLILLAQVSDEFRYASFDWPALPRYQGRKPFSEEAEPQNQNLWWRWRPIFRTPLRPPLDGLWKGVSLGKGGLLRRCRTRGRQLWRLFSGFLGGFFGHARIFRFGGSAKTAGQFPCVHSFGPSSFCHFANQAIKFVDQLLGIQRFRLTQFLPGFFDFCFPIHFRARLNDLFGLAHFFSLHYATCP